MVFYSVMPRSHIEALPILKELPPLKVYPFLCDLLVLFVTALYMSGQPSSQCLFETSSLLSVALQVILIEIYLKICELYKCYNLIKNV